MWVCVCASMCERMFVCTIGMWGFCVLCAWFVCVRVLAHTARGCGLLKFMVQMGGELWILPQS